MNDGGSALGLYPGVWAELEVRKPRHIGRGAEYRVSRGGFRREDARSGYGDGARKPLNVRVPNRVSTRHVTVAAPLRSMPRG